MTETIEKLPYRTIGDWGFTDDINIFRATEQFRDDAAADGWSIRATYGSEDISRASKLNRDGFVMQILTRDNSSEGRGRKFNACVSIWGPDGLAVAVPEFYDFAELSRRTRICAYCKREDVATERVGFAGRCCAECLPKMRTAIEQPGWNN